MWTAVAGVIFLPANGTQIAAAEADETGTTTLGKRVFDHSFQLPLQICVGRHRARRHRDRLPLLRRPHAGAAGADDARPLT